MLPDYFNNVPYLLPVNLLNRNFYNGNLPEEVKETIEEKSDEIESERDIQNIVDESYYRR